MSRFKLLYFVIFIINLYKINAQISDKRLCVDEKCEVPISLAKTLIRYSSPDSRILSFGPNADITIYSKSAGSREDLWGGKINDKRGYVPKHMVRETKVLQKPTLLVDTEFANETETKQVPSKLEPDKVQEPYEVIDGTTIYLNPQEDIKPSTTDSPIQTTALPVGTEKIAQNEQEPGAAEETKSQEVDEKVNQNLDDSLEEEDAEEDDGEIDIDEDEEDDEEEEETSNSTEAVSAEPIPEAAESGELGKVPVKETAEAVDSSEEAQPKVEDSAEKLKDVTSESNENEVKDNDLNSSESLKEPPEPVRATSDVTAESSESTTANNLDLVPSVSEESKEPVASTATPIEVTSITPEIEVPQPFDASIDEVTPNPLQEPVVENVIPTLPPFSLFSAATPEPVVPPQQEETTEKVAEIQNIDGVAAEPKSEETTEKEAETQNAVEPQNGETTEKVAEIQNVEPQSEETTEKVAEMQSSDSVPQELQIEEIPEPAAEILNVDNQSSETNLDTQYTENRDPTSEEDNSTELKTEESPRSEEDIQPTVGEIEEEAFEENTGPGFFGNVLSWLGVGSPSAENPIETLTSDDVEKHVESIVFPPAAAKESYCDAPSCQTAKTGGMDFFDFNPDVFIYLVTTAISVIIFLFGYIAFDKSKREGPLIAKINNLEKQLLIVVKENQILQEKVSTDSGYETNDRVPTEVVENLKLELLEATNSRNALEEQVQSLEKELENSTEVGMELNKMLSEILSSENGSDVIKSNVEHLQRQLVEQQSTINSINETLAVTNTENHELRLELELSNKKVLDLQAELDKLLLNILKIEEEKDTQQSTLEYEITNYRQKYEEISSRLRQKEEETNAEIKQLKNRLDQTARKLELKIREHDVLTETFKQLKTVKNNDEKTVRNLLEVGGIKAEVQLLKTENQQLSEKLQQEQETKSNCEKRARAAGEEVQTLKQKYDEADKIRVETQTKLEVLSNYFKDREAQWQKELSKHEALWAEKEGEATSTTERIKFMQEQLQNYKAQTDSLKQEIMSQEIELKSQISVLEKKAHENWVSARQAERKLEEAKQEAAQLRHRLTLRERTIQEDKNQHRLQSPIEQNGDMPMESPASPPLLYGARDHITTSPPLPGLPPFLPPPPGVPFMPPPIHGVPPFIPPPPNMFPGDHRPPPLGRMSSPPLNSRFSPSSRGYSPYDRNSSSPSDSEYGTSPPHRRAYSPFNSRDREDRRDYKRPPQGRSNGRNMMKGGGSSGSGNSNESLEKINRQQSKV